MGPLLFGACQEEQQHSKLPEIYSGPAMITHDIRTIYSDSARVKVILRAPSVNEYLNGNREFPQGLDLTFFEEDTVSGTLTCNYAKYDKKLDIYTAIGDVVVENKQEQRTVYSEELNWNRKKKKIYTDKHVIVKSAKETIEGDGLDANQDLSSYRIRNFKSTTESL